MPDGQSYRPTDSATRLASADSVDLDVGQFDEQIVEIKGGFSRRGRHGPFDNRLVWASINGEFVDIGWHELLGLRRSRRGSR